MDHPTFIYWLYFITVSLASSKKKSTRSISLLIKEKKSSENKISTYILLRYPLNNIYYMTRILVVFFFTGSSNSASDY